MPETEVHSENVLVLQGVHNITPVVLLFDVRSLLKKIVSMVEQMFRLILQYA